MARSKLEPSGYLAHAAANRRHVWGYLIAYVMAYELIGAFVLILPLLMFDPQHTILSDPAGYAVRYMLPLAVVSGLIFRHIYRGHAKAVMRTLAIRKVGRAEEPRFVAIGEQQCTALGVRFPAFAVIEVDARNCLTVGEGPDHGLIAVTRGLLDALDDDELAAVLAHEAAHIRNGDTRVLAANHALQRTAVLLQCDNPFRIEDWRQLIVPLFLPPFLILLLAGGAATMVAMQLSFHARRGVRLSRDHIADGDAIRMTHFPEALVDALRKVAGRGSFPGSLRVEGMLFDGPNDHDGGTHPPVEERIAAISSLGKELLAPGRSRRDTRSGGSVRRFGVAARAVPGLRGDVLTADAPMQFAYDADGRPLNQPPTHTLKIHAMMLTDPAAYRRWREATIAWYEWRANDKRNAFGMRPQLLIPMAALIAFLAVFHWPRDNDPAKFLQVFSPSSIVSMASQMREEPVFCSSSSASTDSHCGQTIRALNAHTNVGQNAPPPIPPDPFAHSGTRASDSSDGPPDTGFGSAAFLMPLLMFSLVGMAIFSPRTLRRLFGVVDYTPPPPQRETRLPDAVERPAGGQVAPPSTRGFGRKGV